MKNYIVVRLDNLWIGEDGDMFAAGPEGEIQYLAVVSTSNANEDPIVTQTTGFPVRNWYEAEGGGVNSSILGGHERAIPLFCFPESEMGDRLLINITVVDDDKTSEAAILGHAIAAKVGTVVATAAGGPVVGGVVEAVSSQVQTAIEDGASLDFIGTHTNLLHRSHAFGMLDGANSQVVESQDGDITVQYTVLRVATPDEQADWLVSVTLNEIKVLENGDGGDEGEVYVHTRVAAGYADGLLRQTLRRIPQSGTRDVDDNHQFLSGPVQLYFNSDPGGAHFKGLPPFLFVEVDVFESDDGILTPGTTGDDVLGVLPLMFTNRWLREHKGSHAFQFVMHGNDADSEKCRVKVTIDVWDPNEAPF